MDDLFPNKQCQIICIFYMYMHIICSQKVCRNLNSWSRCSWHFYTIKHYMVLVPDFLDGFQKCRINRRRIIKVWLYLYGCKTKSLMDCGYGYGYETQTFDGYWVWVWVWVEDPNPKPRFWWVQLYGRLTRIFLAL